MDAHALPRMSVCMPALNEEKTLRAAVEDLRGELAPHLSWMEIIIVNDGSTDSTPSCAQELAKEFAGIKVIHHQRRIGVGSCYRDALAVAEGDYYTWFPADHENAASELLHCLQHLRPDVVVTSHHKGCDPRMLRRKIVSAIYTGLLNTLFGLKVTYYNGLTIFPLHVLRSFPLVSDGFVFQAEAMIRALRSGCRLIELQAALKERTWGKSKAFTLSSLMHAARDASRIVRSMRGRRMR